jgi:glycosyltransferase involved in cell wall biosynthesis
MRILVVHHHFGNTGASLAMLDLALHLQARGHELGVRPLWPPRGPVAERYRAAGIPILADPSGHFDLAIAVTLLAAPLVAQLAKSTPVVWWLHEGDNALPLLLKNPAWSRAFRQATALVFQTRYQPERVYASFLLDTPAERSVVIPNGVALPEGNLPPPPIPKSDRARVVCLGTLESRKRPIDLIRALRKPHLAEAEIVFAGKLTEHGEALRGQVAERPALVERVRFTGPLSRESALALLGSADCLAHPSSAESQPLVFFEAGLLGKPILMADLPTYAGLWRHGENCLMHPAGDVDMLAEHLGIVLRNRTLAGRLGEAARQTARRFTQQDFFAAFDRLLESTARPVTP